MKEGQAMDQADIFSATREADQTKHLTDKCDLAFLSRMMDLGGCTWGSEKRTTHHELQTNGQPA